MKGKEPGRALLARLSTPLERLGVSAGLGVELWCKRDDLTGAALSGNKVRKLEYLFHEAREKGATTVITCGGEQSNHCRATAVAAARLGLKSYLLLRTDDPAHPPADQANILLDRLVGAEIHWVSREEYRRRAAIFPRVEAELRARGETPYVIPEGGSNALGSWGYIRCVEELAAELPAGPATLVYAAGSGGTGAGLLLGIKRLGLPWRAVGFNVCDDEAYFVRVISEIAAEASARFHLDPLARKDIEIVDGYVGLGYAKSSPPELETLRDLARAEGLVLDPVYTGKAMHGLLSELRARPGRFGSRIVFLHTGGMFGLFAQAAELAAVLRSPPS